MSATPATLTDASTVPVELMSLAELFSLRRDLLAALRLVDHWRRLVSGRLDLAVAAITGIDEPDRAPILRHVLPAGVLPAGLGELVGLPGPERRLDETGRLLRLRAVLGDLDRCAVGLQARTDEIVGAIAARLAPVEGRGA